MLDFIIQYWTSFLFGLLITFLTFLLKLFQNHKKLLKTIQNGVQELLRMQILENYKRYELRGTISLYEKETMYDLYKQYKLLGGNGLVSQIMDDMEKIPPAFCQPKEEKER